MVKRIFALFLVLVLIISLSGCTKDNKEGKSGTGNAVSDNESSKADGKMGRYMEQEVELPKLEGNEHIIKILQNEQQQFEVYAQSQRDGKFVRYILLQDNTWTQDAPGWLNTERIRQLQLVDLCLGQDGRYYACVQNNLGSARTIIYKASEDGTTSEMVKLPYFDEVVKKVDGKKYYPSIQKMEVLKNGEFVLCDAWSRYELVILSADGDKVDTVDTDQDKNFRAIGNNILGINKEGKIFSYNAETKKTDKTLDYDGNDSNKVYAVKADGTILMGDSEGIHRLVSGGTLWETMVDGALSVMGMPSLTIDSLYVTGDDSNEEYDIAYKDMNGSYQLKHYKFDKDIPAVPDKEITIYSLKDNKTIRQAISLYQAKNAEVKISYVVAMGDEGGNATDYIRALNTELLSGNGADILVLDGLPAASYIEKGVLADISDIIGKQYKDGTLLTNIVDNYYKDGKTYYIPVRFSVPLRIGDPEALKESNQLSGLAAYLNKSDEPFMPPTSYEAIIRDSLAEYYDDLCVKGVLEQGKLKEFLEVMKQLSVNSKSEVDLYQHTNYADAGGNLYVVSNKDLFGNNSGILDPCETVTMQINNVFDTIIPNAAILNRRLGFDTMGQRFIPKGVVGLNKASKEADLSKDFISFLLTSEVQETSLNDGFPINSSSLKKWFDEEHPGFGYVLGDDEGNSITGSWPLKKRRDVFFQAINEVNKPIEINQIVFDMIINSGVTYLSGELDIDQTTSEIMTKVNTYLAE